jgi:hypothetical protein
LKAFERLARRYPPQSFPERFARIIEARNLLLGNDPHWREQILSRMGYNRITRKPGTVSKLASPVTNTVSSSKVMALAA